MIFFSSADNSASQSTFSTSPWFAGADDKDVKRFFLVFNNLTECGMPGIEEILKFFEFLDQEVLALFYDSLAARRELNIKRGLMLK